MIPEDSLFQFNSSESESIPPRSLLFAIPPYGLGTWKVEGLPSYIKRLSEAHAIPVIQLSKIVFREYSTMRGQPESKIEQSKIWWDGIGGTGERTRAWVNGLNPLLKINRTIETTLLPISDHVPMRGLLSPVHRHCPKCVRADYSNGCRYRYLLWDIRIVNYCPFHECQLEEEVPLINFRKARWRSIEGHGQPTSMVPGSANNTSDPYQASEMHRALLVANLLESPLYRSGFPTGPKSGTAYFLNEAIRKLVDGVASHLATHLRVAKGSLHGWTSGTHLPSLEQVVDIAQALNCSIESVLAGDATQLPLVLSEYSKQKPRKQRVIHHVKGSQFRIKLIRFISQNSNKMPPPSVSEIAREFGVDRTQIVRVYPDIAKQVSRNLKEWITRRAKVIRSVRHHAYREAAIALAKAGQFPTRNRVMNFLANISVFSERDRNICQAICNEVRQDFQFKGR